MAEDIPQPRGRGRPATGQVPKRYFRMDDEGWEQVNQAAIRNGQTTSEFVRQSLLKASAVRAAKQPKQEE